MPYFVLNKQQYDGHHEVHNTQLTNKCTYPEVQNQINLGFHDTCRSALIEANKRFSADIDGCAFCTNCHTK